MALANGQRSRPALVFAKLGFLLEVHRKIQSRQAAIRLYRYEALRLRQLLREGYLQNF
jgi:hypothetical protein